MSKREVCFLIGRDGAILWSDASDNPAALPDSRERWRAIWHHRHELDEIAHSHPNGPAELSGEDISTMKAVESGLGRTLRFSVVAPYAMVARCGDEQARIDNEPWWAGLMRLASGMQDRGAKPAPALEIPTTAPSANIKEN